MGLLARWERGAITVLGAQKHIQAAGVALVRSHASNALASLAAQGLVEKTARGRFRIRRDNPQLIALRMAALETELAATPLQRRSVSP